MALRIGSVCGAGNASAERKRQEMKRSAVTGCKHPVTLSFRAQRASAARGGIPPAGTARRPRLRLARRARRVPGFGAEAPCTL